MELPTHKQAIAFVPTDNHTETEKALWKRKPSHVTINQLARAIGAHQSTLWRQFSFGNLSMRNYEKVDQLFKSLGV